MTSFRDRIVLLVACLALTSPFQAQQKTLVKAVVQCPDYPKIDAIVNVRDAATGKGIYGLAQSAFAIVENGVLQEPDSFLMKAEKKVEPIDIAFVFDQTGSMQDEINAVKNNALMFADILRGSFMDYRLALVTFGDWVISVKDYTPDVEVFKGWVSGIQAAGGGDEAENDLEALSQALQLKARPGAQVVFILITDAPYHQNDSVTKLSMLPLAKKIKLEGIRVYPIAANYPQYQWLARETDGLYMDILKDFSSIIEDLAVTLTAQYRIRYTTKNPSFDNTQRNVEVQVKPYGPAKAFYRSGANISASSQLIENNRPSDAYRAAHLADGKDSTCWAEGAEGPGIGEWVQFGFDTPKTVKALKIIAGYPKTAAVFQANNRVKKVMIVFSDGESQTATLADQKEFQRVLIDRDKPTRFVKLVIMEVYKGTKYDDTCVSEVEFEYK
jgi:Mg-chelatase subunit ChlD